MINKGANIYVSGTDQTLAREQNVIENIKGATWEETIK